MSHWYLGSRKMMSAPWYTDSPNPYMAYQSDLKNITVSSAVVPVARAFSSLDFGGTMK